MANAPIVDVKLLDGAAVVQMLNPGAVKTFQEYADTVFLPYVTKSRKMVPNHTFLFHYIYYCNMNSIAFSTLFHIITWNLTLKLSKLCNKYSGNTYA